MNNTIIAICGPSASGKSTLEKCLVKDASFKKVVSFTTRSMRDGEVDGKDYYFITPEDYELFKSQKLIAQETHFNGVTYGSFYSEYTKAFEHNQSPVIVIVPGSLPQIASIADKTESELYTVFLSNNIKTLITRFLSRDSSSNVEFMADRIISIFNEHKDWPKTWLWDMVVNEFNPGDEVAVMNHLIKLMNAKL